MEKKKSEGKWGASFGQSELGGALDRDVAAIEKRQRVSERQGKRVRYHPLIISVSPRTIAFAFPVPGLLMRAWVPRMQASPSDKKKREEGERKKF